MATLAQNIEQAISDFDDIEAAIKEQGVDVTDGTDTSEYGNLIRRIQGSGGSSPIKYVESLDSENPLYLRDLESGTYILYGKFRPFNGSTSSCTFSTGMLVSVIRNTSISYLQIFYSKNNTIQYCEITDDTYERKDAKLINMESTANLTTSIDENSDDTHYPSAKAVWDALGIRRLESLDTENMKYMRDIESGYYLMHGYFEPYPNSDTTVILDTMCVSVVRVDEGSHLMAFSPLNFKIRCYEILVDDTVEDGFVFNSWVINLLELNELIDRVGTLEEQAKQDTGNALKATASGEIIRVDDVSTIEHTAKAKVYGKNYFCEKSDNEVKTHGITCTFQANKSEIVINGTADVEWNIVIPNTIILSAGTYTASVHGLNTNSGGNDRIFLRNVETNAVIINSINSNAPRTFTLDKEAEIKVNIVFKSGSSYDNALVKIQIEEGDTATEYEPYIDPTTVTVTRCGKNILPNIGTTMTGNGITYTVNADGSVTCNGTATKNAVINLTENYRLPLGTYILRGCPSTGSDTTYRLQTNKIINGEVSTGCVDVGSSARLNITQECQVYTYIVVLKDTTVSNITFYPQLLPEAETDTTYEPYNGETYTPTANGVVEISSVSPTMTLLTDTAGVNIDVEYNQDTNAFADNVKTDLQELDNVTAELVANMGDIETIIVAQEAQLSNISNITNGDSENAVRQVGENIAGCNGYHITEISTPTLGGDNLYRITYKLDCADKPNYSVGDVCTIRLNANYDNCGEITAISKNEIEVKLYKTDLTSLPTTLYTETEGDINSFRVPLKPTVGDIDVGKYAFASGNGNFAVGAYSFTTGYSNQAIGKYSHVAGVDNIAIYAAHAEGRGNKAIGEQSHAEGLMSIASGESSHAEGQQTVASGRTSHAEGYRNTASGLYAHAEGGGNTASGDNSHAEGVNSTASASYSHAEGNTTTASGNQSHAEGIRTQAIGSRSHAEGFESISRGISSHAEGENTHAKGVGCHAEGNHTIATGQYQHAQGKYNIEDTSGRYAHIVGNGESDAERSNAHTLDWRGNAWYAGNGEFTSIILRSSTEGSTKKFEVTVDDSGTLSVTEYTKTTN